MSAPDLKNNKNKNLIVSLAEASEIAGVSKDTLRRWERSGRIRSTRTKGGHRRFTIAAIEAAISNKPKRRAAVEYIDLSRAAKIAGVSKDTIRRWDNTGKLNSKRTKGGHRRFLLEDIKNLHQPAIAKQPRTHKVMHVFEAKPGVEPKIIADNEVKKAQKRTRLSRKQISAAIEEIKIYRPISIDQGKALSWMAAFAIFIFSFISMFKGIALVRGIADEFYNQGLGQLVLDTQIDSKVLADRDSLLTSRLEFNTLVNFNDQVNLIGNILTSDDDLLIDPGGGGVRIGDGTPVNVDQEGGDLFVLGDLEIGGFLSLNNDNITDFTGTGLQLTAGVLETTLGESITSTDIEDATISEVDLNVTNTPSDNQILSYDSATGTFTWVADATGEDSPWTDGGSLLYLDTTTDNLVIGGSTDLGKITINGDTDEIQLVVQGHSTQTANLSEWQDSDGNVLSYVDANGNFVGSVTGTVVTGFSQGSVVFTDSSGNLTQDNSNLFWDDTNNRLGIGTNTPSVGLEVAGDVEPAVGSTYDLGSNTRRWSTIWGDTANFTNLSSTTTDLSGTTSNDFTINTDNATLDLEDATLTFERGTLSTNAELRWDSTNKYISTNSPGFFINPDSNIIPSGKASLMVNQIQSQDIFTASASGLQRFTIANNGDVTIGDGTESPTILIDGPNNTSDSGITLNYSQNLFGTDVTGLHIKGQNSNDRFAGIRVQDGDTVATYVDLHQGRITARWDGPASADMFKLQRGATQRLAIFDDVVTNNVVEIQGGTTTDLAFTEWNNVGIGTTSPTSKLHLEGAVTGKALSIFNETGDQDIFTASASGTTRFVIQNDGDVGIGTVTPTSRFEILGRASIVGLKIDYTTNYANTPNALQVDGVNSSVVVSNEGKFSAEGGCNAIGGTQNCEATLEVFAGSGVRPNLLLQQASGGQDVFQWENSTGTVVGVIDNSGDVGIGTTSPTSKLHLEGAVTGKALSIFNETGDQDIFTASASGTTRFVIDNSGNVGIGTSTPTAKLEIDTATGAGGDQGLIVRTTDDLNNVNLFEIQSSAGLVEGYLGYDTVGGKLVIQRAGSDTNSIALSSSNLVIKSSGSQDSILLPQSGAINAFNPKILLSRGNGIIDIDTSVTDSGTAILAELSSANSLTTSGAKLLSLKNNNVEKFYVDKDGGAYFDGDITTGGSIAGFWEQSSHAIFPTEYWTDEILIGGNSTASATIRLAANGQITATNDILISNAEAYRILDNVGSVQNVVILDSGNNLSVKNGTAAGAAFYGTSGTGQVQLQTGNVDRFSIAGSTGIGVFNETGLSTADFRIEGDTDANLFFVDASADGIGIGTNSPDNSSLLDIENTYNSGNGSYHGMEMTLTRQLQGSLETGNFRGLILSSVLDDQTVSNRNLNAEWVGVYSTLGTQNSASNYGVGAAYVAHIAYNSTTVPNGALYLFKGGGATGLLGLSNMNDLYGLYLPTLTGTNGTSYSIYTTDGNAIFNDSGEAGSDFRIEGDTDANLLFVDASTDAVGIGTSSPGTKLDVSGGVIRTIDGSDYISLDSTATNPEINIYLNGGYHTKLTGLASGLAITSGGTGTTSVATFDTNNAFLYGTSLSLGETSDTSTFSIDAKMFATAAGEALRIRTYNASGTDTQRFGITGREDTADAYFINSNLGIGTSSPDHQLEVSGFYAGNALVSLNDTGGNDIFTASASGTTRFVIQNDGDVGIGTNSPLARLSIGTTASLTNGSNTFIAGLPTLGTTAGDIETVGEFRMLAGGGSTGRLMFYGLRSSTADSWQTSKWRIQPSIDNSFTGDDSNRGYLEFAPNGTSNRLGLSGSGSSTPDFVISSTANIGIGDVTPESRLKVATDLTNLTGKSVLILDQLESEDIFTASASGTTRFVIKNDGDVYIGGSTGNGELNLPGGGGIDWSGEKIINGSGVDLQFQTNNNTRLIIDNSGNIGIGTTSPTTKLHLSGNSTLTGKALAIFDQTESQDIFTASASGTTKFTIQNSGLTDASVDGIATLVNAGAITDGSYSGTAVDGLLGVDSSNGRLYFRYGGGWHYTAQTAGFQIPDYEAFSYDFNSGSFDESTPLAEGDFLIPFVESTMEDGAKHGLYAKFSDVKDELFADITDRLDSQEQRIAELETSLLGGYTASSSASLDTNFADISVSGETVLGDVTVTGVAQIGTIIVDGFENSLDAAGVLQIQPLALGNIELMAGKVELDTEGNINILEGHIAGNSSFRDSIAIEEGMAEVRVEREWDTAPATINVTPNWNTNVWVTDRDETGFTINFDPPSSDDSGETSWVAIW